MKIFFLTILLFLICTSKIICKEPDSTKANNTRNYNSPNNFIGFSASTFSSFGLSYHVLLDRKSLGFKISFGIYPDKYSSSELWKFIGSEIHLNFFKSTDPIIYLLGGIGAVFDNKSSFLMYGVGFGIEFYIYKKSIAFNIELGPSWFSHPSDNLAEVNLGLGIGLGISYAF